MKLAVAVVLVVVLCAAAGLAALAWRASARAVHPGPASYAWSAADFPELAAEEVTVDSSTGARLAGRFFPGSKRATIVLTHGYGGTQDEMLPVAAALHRKGYTVFTYDTRGCGRSSGEVTFGAREQDDLISVVDHLVSRPDVDSERIGALGFSMGGATTLLAAARDPRIKAVVADSAWKTAKSWLRPSVRAVFLHPRNHFSALALTFAELLDRRRPRRPAAGGRHAQSFQGALSCSSTGRPTTSSCPPTQRHSPRRTKVASCGASRAPGTAPPWPRTERPPRRGSATSSSALSASRRKRWRPSRRPTAAGTRRSRLRSDAPRPSR